MKSNFEFLRRYWPALAEIGATAEGYLFTFARRKLMIRRLPVYVF